MSVRADNRQGRAARDRKPPAAPLEHVTSLWRISSLPAAFDAPEYHRYSGLKLGVVECVEHYAEKMAEVAGRLVGAHPDRRWIFTAPPFTGIPAAANLLCWQVRDRLAARRTCVPVENIFEHARHIPSQRKAPATIHLSYAQLPAHDRLASRLQSLDRLQPVPAFNGASIVFFNDINVTGAQQRAMSRYFTRMGAASVDWLYLFDVDRQLGEDTPQLEHALNSSGIATFEAFSDVVCEANIRYTSKCIWRLLACDVERLEELFRRLPRGRGEEILDLVNSEALGEIEAFRESAALLNRRFRRS